MVDLHGGKVRRDRMPLQPDHLHQGLVTLNLACYKQFPSKQGYSHPATSRFLQCSTFLSDFWRKVEASEFKDSAVERIRHTQDGHSSLAFRSKSLKSFQVFASSLGSGDRQPHTRLTNTENAVQFHPYACYREVGMVLRSKPGYQNLTKSTLKMATAGQMAWPVHRDKGRMWGTSQSKRKHRSLKK